VIAVDGQTRNKTYRLASLVAWSKDYLLKPGISEDHVWRQDIAPSLGRMPENVIAIWHYGFTEMFNNTIDHSNGSQVRVVFEKSAAATTILIYDDGVGIFKKIQTALGLSDERHAVLELAKGKFTTDPANHSGEGIFFTSRMFDDFDILSGGVYFSHKFESKEDWILQNNSSSTGTLVSMKLNNHTSRNTRKVYSKYTSGDDRGFNKTVVPVALAQYGDDNLVSRSQAKRLLSRIDRFKVVVFDFAGVKSIGQAFADEIFRVFANRHQGIELTAVNTNTEVNGMISRALVADGGA
jgi:anti-sigma regulatory factor (Ser/Thr protein kinase)